MVIYLFNFYEWWWLHYFSEIIFALGGYEGAVAVTLFGLIIFADTFAAVFLISFLFRGIPALIRWVRD
jgi:hypothetical protein